MERTMPEPGDLWRLVEERLGKDRVPARARVAIARAVDKVAYEILDEIVCPVVGIKGVYADITQAEIALYLSDTKREAVRQRKEIIARIAKRYGASEYALSTVWHQPIALVALVAMGKGEYRSYAEGDKKGRAIPAEEAWACLAHTDEHIRPAQVVRAKVFSTPAHGIHLRRGRWEILVHVTDVPWCRDVGPDEYAKVGEWLDVTILRTVPGETATVGWLPWPKKELTKKASRAVARRRAMAKIKKASGRRTRVVKEGQC